MATTLTSDTATETLRTALADLAELKDATPAATYRRALTAVNRGERAPQGTRPVTTAARAVLDAFAAVHDERRAVVAEWRSPCMDVQALVEYVIYQGRGRREIATALGLTDGGVDKRLQAYRRATGITSYGARARRDAARKGIERPYRHLDGDDALVAEVVAEYETSVADRDALVATSVELREVIVGAVAEAKTLGLAPSTITRAMGITMNGLARLRENAAKTRG